ncbi:MAG: hypothetical protein J0M28_09110 [Thauera sp.]|nr:hypothetical protein [Thauera sp.]
MYSLSKGGTRGRTGTRSRSPTSDALRSRQGCRETPGAGSPGVGATILVQSLAVAMTCGATKRDFDRTIAVHPTTAEEFVLMRQPSRSAGPVAAPVS